MTRLPNGARVKATLPSGERVGTVVQPTGHTHENFTRVIWDGTKRAIRYPTYKLEVVERREGPNPLKLPPRVKVLRDIADEIESTHPIQANWLRNIASEMTLNLGRPGTIKRAEMEQVVGAQLFDRRQQSS